MIHKTGVLCVAAALFLTGLPTVSAATSADWADSIAADAAIIAGQQGWTTAETEQHLETQHEFGSLVDVVAQRFERHFAGAEFAAKPQAASVLRFKGPVPQGARQTVAATGLNVELISGAPFTEAELEARLANVITFFRDRGFLHVVAAAQPDGSIEVAVTGADGPALPAPLADDVNVTFVEREVSVDEHTYGGLLIDGAVSECTTGFSVVSQITGRTGVVTAGHCTAMDTYHPRTGSAYDTFGQHQHVGVHGDVEWHTTPHGEFAQYYADAAGQPSDFRDVDSVETSAAVNNWYCVWSRERNQRTCDQVYSTIAANGLVANLIMMDDDNTDPGDSGGPWSWGTEAVGIHQGDSWLLKTRNVWTKTWALDSALDLEVITCAKYQC